MPYPGHIGRDMNERYPGYRSECVIFYGLIKLKLSFFDRIKKSIGYFRLSFCVKVGEGHAFPRCYLLAITTGLLATDGMDGLDLLLFLLSPPKIYVSVKANLGENNE